MIRKFALSVLFTLIVLGSSIAFATDEPSMVITLTWQQPQDVGNSTVNSQHDMDLWCLVGEDWLGWGSRATWGTYVNDAGSPYGQAEASLEQIIVSEDVEEILCRVRFYQSHEETDAVWHLVVEQRDTVLIDRTGTAASELAETVIPYGVLVFEDQILTPEVGMCIQSPDWTRANIRNQASEDAELVGVLAYGDMRTIEEIDGSWYRIGTDQWVASWIAEVVPCAS